MKLLHFYYCSYLILSPTSYFVILVAPHICGMCAFVIFVFCPLRNLSFKEGRSARRGFMRINLGNGTPVPGKDGKNCKTVKIVKTVMAHCTLSFRLLHALGFKFCNKMMPHLYLAVQHYQFAFIIFRGFLLCCAGSSVIGKKYFNAASSHDRSGWQVLGDRRTGVPQMVRIFPKGRFPNIILSRFTRF